jgi:hypothetical protein
VPYGHPRHTAPESIARASSASMMPMGDGSLRPTTEEFVPKGMREFIPGAGTALAVNAGEFVPGGSSSGGSGGGGGGVGGGGVREFRPGQEFMPGSMRLTATTNAEFVPGGGGGIVREFRPGQEFVPGGGMAVYNAYADENGGMGMGMSGAALAPNFVPQQMGGAREFVPGHQFIPDADPDGEESMMQPILDEDDNNAGDYGYDENGEYVGDGGEYATDPDYAAQGEEDSWSEFAATVLGDGTSDDAVTYAVFDPGEELVWSGSTSGKLASHWVSYEDNLKDDEAPPLHPVPQLRLVTQVRAFKPGCPVRGVLALQDAVLALGDTAVRAYTRGGLPMAYMPALDEAQDLLCMEVVAQTQGLVCGGRSCVLTSIDLPTCQASRGYTFENHNFPGVVSIKSASRFLACAGLDGQVSLHDPRSLRLVHTVLGHTGPVTGLDLRQHLMVTCGMNVFRGRFQAEPTIKVFDLRRHMGPLAQIPIYPPMGCPVLLKYNPKFSSTLHTACNDGSFIMCDVGGCFIMPGEYPVAETISAMDVSTSGELIVFGDDVGGLYLWGDKHAMVAKGDHGEPVTVNGVGISAETAIPSRRPPSLADSWTEDKPLSEVPMPPIESALMSDWPGMPLLPNLPAQILDDAFMASVTYQKRPTESGGKDFVGYASNPGFKRGQTHKGIPWLRRLLKGDKSDEESPEGGGGGGIRPSEKRTVRKWMLSIDRNYRLQEIKLGKLGIVYEKSYVLLMCCLCVANFDEVLLMGNQASRILTLANSTPRLSVGWKIRSLTVTQTRGSTRCSSSGPFARTC